MRRFLFPSLVLAVALGAGAIVPARVAAQETPAPTRDAQLADGVAFWIADGVAHDDFSTGAALFDQEWSFGTRQMAALGFAQHAAASDDPARRAEAIARMEACLDGLLSEEGRRFDAGKWGEDPIAALDGPNGHAAWLGYTNLALSAHRALVPDSRFAALNDRVTAAIARRVAAEPTGLPETYPGERYPVDTAAGVASVALYDRATGADHGALLDQWKTLVRGRYLVDGVLVQAVRHDGTVRDGPRGSGTFLAAWFLSWGDPAFAAEIYAGGRRALYQDLGFAGAMREYPPGREGRGDVDSGPVVAGLGVSATGFAIGAARAAGDDATAAALGRLADMVGRPEATGGRVHWQAGAALGGAPLADAILFAMLTTPSRLAVGPPPPGGPREP
jgi:hypothetical protein